MIGTAMDSSQPPTPETDTPPPRRELLDTVAAQVRALDELVGIAQRSIRVFDIDLSQMGWNSLVRADALGAFLRRSPHARFECIVHDTRHIEGHCPRLTSLRNRYSHLMSIAITGPQGRRARDPLVLVDDRHFLHRYDFEQPRATFGIEQPIEAQPLIDRFNEIWETRESMLPGTLLGI
jgi:hypothetical protein